MKKVILTICVVIASLPTEAQIFDKIGKVAETVSNKISLKELQRDPVTTSFSDVDKERHIEDTFGSTAAYLNIHSQPFTEPAGFQLQPGFYEAEFDSFCIKAGTYAPTSGSGRFYAELEGPKADIFETILRAFQEKKVAKQDAQLLFWAIIAKTDFAKMKGRVKATALKILSPEDIARLSTNALESLAKKELRKLSYKSKAARAIIDAENNLRSKYYSAVNDYAEYEEIAMLAGLEPIVNGWETGRWTKHPDGYFIRYYPSGYQKTRTQIYVPEDAGVVYFNAFGDVAVPAHTSSQRLLQSNSPYGTDTWEGGVFTDSSSNQDNNIACHEKTDSQIDKIIQQEMLMQNLPGMAVGVFQNGKLIHLKGYGYTNVVTKNPITLSTIMHWASVSKSVTATAALQLKQDPAIDYNLSDLVTKHCSYWPSELDYCDVYPGLSVCAERNVTLVDRRQGNITIKHLLQNRSGIQHYGRGRDWNNDNKGDTKTLYSPINDSLSFLQNSGYISEPDEYNAESAVGIFKNSVIDFDPGTNYNYTTYGFNLAGATIEEASPNGYVDWIMKHIANKAGMTSFQVANEMKREGHDMPTDGILKIIESGDKESVLPGGGWESNICDFTKYAIGLSSGKFYDQSKDSIWVNNGRTYRYGVNATGSGNNFRVWHGGKHSNMRTYMQFYPGDTTGLVLMSPVEYSNLSRVARYIFQLLGKNYSPAAPTPLDSCRVDMKNDNDLFSGIWRKTGNDVVIRTGRSHEEFYDEVNRLRKSDYEIKDIEAFIHNNTLYWDGVFQKGIRPTKIWRNASKEAFIAKCREMRKDGYRLWDVETYLDENNNRLWAGVFRQIEDGYSVQLDRTTTEFAEVREKEQKKGKKLIDIEVYHKNGQLMWSGVWTMGEPNKLNRNYSIEEFQELLSNRKSNGYRLVDVELYVKTPGGPVDFQVAAIWEKSSDDEENILIKNFCDTMVEHEDFSSKGYELIDWDRVSIEISD